MKFYRGRDARLGFSGRAELCRIESDCLRDNALGDSALREVPVYLPPGHDTDAAQLPLILVLSGFTGRGHKYWEPQTWSQSVTQAFDAQVASGESAPAVLLMPDCFTRLGGSQYVDSIATGAYETHVMHELLPAAIANLAVDPERVAVAGKSSGGFGALHLAMQHPGAFRAAASVSGDCDFELCFGAEMLSCLRGLVPYDMDPARFLEAFRERPNLAGDGHAVINVLAMSACYSPNPDSALGFDLPMTLDDGRRVQSVWERWLRFDPLEACREHAAALQQLDLLHLECGLNDEFNLQWGLRRLVKVLDELAVPHVHVEHSGGHRGIDERYRVVLPELARALSR